MAAIFFWQRSLVAVRSKGTFGKPLGRLAERACAEAAFRGNSSCENCAFVGVIVGGSEPSEPPGKAVNLLCEKGRRPIGAETGRGERLELFQDTRAR